MMIIEKKEKLASGIFGANQNYVENFGPPPRIGVPEISDFEDDFMNYIKRLTLKNPNWCKPPE